MSSHRGGGTDVDRAAVGAMVNQDDEVAGGGWFSQRLEARHVTLRPFVTIAASPE